MKKLLSRTSVAVLIAVIVVISTVLLQTRFRFGRICDSVTAQFYHHDGNSSSISAELIKFSDAAELLAGLGQLNGLNESESVISEVSSLRDLLYRESNDIQSIHILYKDLLSKVFTLESLLSRLELSEADATVLSSAQHDAAQAKAAIDSSDYHITIRDFLKRYDRFPTPSLASLVGLNMPQAFS